LRSYLGESAHLAFRHQPVQLVENICDDVQTSRAGLRLGPDHAAQGLECATARRQAKYAEDARQLQYERDMLDRLALVPGVRAATSSVGCPIVGSMRASGCGSSKGAACRASRFAKEPPGSKILPRSD